MAHDPQDLHLVRRITFGPTPGLLDEVATMGRAAFLAEQLDPAGIDDGEVDAILAQFETLELSPAQLYADFNAGLIVGELQAAAFLRAWRSRRQLLEVMVDFWTNHLNVFINAGQTVYLKTVEDRAVIRPHALGKFRNLLLASAASPAMLVYLDNATSRADGGRIPNQNYARELLELHTVGVDGGYDEDDVVAVSYVLSGWTVDPATGLAQFRPEWHDLGPAAGHDILGFTPSPASGTAALWNGIGLLAHLAGLPQTAQFLSWKLCRRFVRDDVVPSDPVVQAAAGAYLAADTDIRATLQAIFDHPDFWASAGSKVRRPHDFLPAAYRALGAELVLPQARQALLAAINTMGRLGQPLFQYAPPDGYPDVAAPWLSAGGMLTRWQAVHDLAYDQVPGTTWSPTALIGTPPPATIGEGITRLADALPLDGLTFVDQLAMIFGIYGLGVNLQAPVTPADLDALRQYCAFRLSHPGFQQR